MKYLLQRYILLMAVVDTITGLSMLMVQYAPLVRVLHG